MTTKFPITTGPSKFDLMVALFERGRVVRFGMDGFALQEVVVNDLKAEDGSKEIWFFAGFAKASPKWLACNGYFNLTNRRGWIKIEGWNHCCHECGNVHQDYGVCPKCDNKHCKECFGPVEGNFICPSCLAGK